MSANRYGVVASYVHHDAQLGALVELCCESRAASLSAELRALANDLAMHVAAANPLVVCIEDLTPDMLDAASRGILDVPLRAGRAEPVVQRVAAARMEQFHEQSCLLEQKFVKDGSRTIHQLLDDLGSQLHERLWIVRFARFRVSELPADLAIRPA
jgi:elongation factor Ts